ncbi:alpha/beta fold hydrolase [Streptomyces sp. NPDC052051]|uniref:thioesterase II family protein n=1 Tax=Streptomyces sp. NPDC052051 TaxID=3154649 RepID=UPI0034493D9E
MTDINETKQGGSAADARSSLWIRRFHPSPERRMRLLCLPHAGGAAPAFHALSKVLSPDIEVLAVQYPGRQDRRDEPMTDDVASLADGIVRALTPWTSEPFAVFGHSMGAVVGFEVVRRLERQGVRPVALFASGRRAPGRYRPDRVHLLDDAGLVEEIRSLDGTDTRVFDNEELLSLVLPVIRGDYRAIETYTCPPDAVVDCPTEVLVGETDSHVTRAEALAWGEHTTAGAEVTYFPGGHFYLSEQFEGVTRVVRERLAVHA